METHPFDRKAILIVDDVHAVFLNRLKEANVSYDYFPALNLSDTSKIIHNYTGLVIRSKFQIDRDFLRLCKHLKVIARAGAGMDNIDEQAAKEESIMLLNAPEGNRDAVAEHLIGMLLTLFNRLKSADSSIRNGLWLREEHRGLELGGKTVGLIGYGNNGQAMARKLAGFNVNVLAYDKYKTAFSDQYARESTMDELWESADILSFHIPLTEETAQLADEKFLLSFRKPIFILNAARGGIIDIPSLLKAIETGAILGAALDVLPVEKHPTLHNANWYEALMRNEKVLLSPHVAGWTIESYFKIADVLATKLIAFYKNNKK